jgi:hypothetical protein
MGICESKRDRQSSAPTKESAEELGKFTKSLSRDDFPMRFYFQIKNLKGVNLRETDIYLEVECFGLHKFKTHPIYQKSNPSWQIEESFEIKIHSQEDFGRVLIVKLFNVKGTYLGNIRSTFYELATGPIRNYFVINSKSSYIGRFEFDVRLSQFVELKLEIDKFKVRFLEFQKNFDVENIRNVGFRFSFDNGVNTNLETLPFLKCESSVCSLLKDVECHEIEDFEFEWQAPGLEGAASNFDESISEKTSLLALQCYRDSKRLLSLETERINNLMAQIDDNNGDLNFFQAVEPIQFEDRCSNKAKYQKTSSLHKLALLQSTKGHEVEDGFSLQALKYHKDSDDILTHRTNFVSNDKPPSISTAFSNTPKASNSFNMKSAFLSNQNKTPKQTLDGNSIAKLSIMDEEDSGDSINPNELVAVPTPRQVLRNVLRHAQSYKMVKSTPTINDAFGGELNRPVRSDLKFTIRADQLHYTHMIVNIIQMQTSSDQTTQKVLSLGYLPLDFFFHSRGNHLCREESSSYTADFSMWKLGHFVGLSQVTLKLSHASFFRQTKAGIRTEEGVFCSSELLRFKQIGTSKANDSEASKILRKLNDDFNQFIFDSSGNQNVDNGSFFPTDVVELIGRFKEDIHRRLATTKFTFGTSEEISSLQHALIQLIKTLLKLLREVDFAPNLKRQVYQGLQILIGREELSLNFLGYSDEQRELMTKKAISGKIRKSQGPINKSFMQLNDKSNLVHEFIRMFQKMFTHFEKKLSAEDLDDTETDFLGFLMIHFYLKIPSFRHSLIAKLQVVAQAAGGFFPDFGIQRLSGMQFPSDKHFVMILSSDPDNRRLLDELQETFGNSKSIYDLLMSEKKHITNIFISKLFNLYENEYVAKHNNTWNSLCGYEEFVQFVYFQVRQLIRLGDGTEDLFTAVIAITANLFFFNLFIPLLLGKTDLNDFAQVDQMFELLAHFFEASRRVLRMKSQIVMLDCNLLVKFICVILSNEHLLAIEKCLFFLYKYISFLHDNVRLDLWRRFFNSERFFQYFCHWSFSTRRVFYHFIIFNYHHYESELDIEKEYKALIDRVKSENVEYKRLRDSRPKALDRKSRRLRAKPQVSQKSVVTTNQLFFDKKLRVYTERVLEEYDACYKFYQYWQEKSTDRFSSKMGPEGRRRVFDFPEIHVKVFNDKSEFNLSQNDMRTMLKGLGKKDA